MPSSREDRVQDLLLENEHLRASLREAQETLDAIREGAVDAVVVNGPIGQRVYTLTGADRPYRILFETMSEGAAILSPDGTVLFSNLTLCEMLKIPHESFVGSSINPFLGAANNNLTLAAFSETKPIEAKKIEIHLKSYDGNLIPCLMSVSSVVTEDTSAICVIFTDLTKLKNAEKALQESHDQLEKRVADRTEELAAINERLLQQISEREAVEKALRQSDEKFRLFMDNSPTIAWMKDDQGRHVYLSGTCEKRFGVTLDLWSGKTDFELWPKEIAEAFWKNDQAVLAAGQTMEVVEDTVDDNGNRCSWLNYKFPLQDASGQRYVAGIGIDITDRKKAEEEKESLRAQLLQSQKMQALGTLAAGIAHDFNNMLQVILGYADLLVSDKRPGEPGHAELKRIIETSRDAADLVQKIRILSRRADIQRLPFDLNKNIREVVDLVKRTLPGTAKVTARLSGNLDIINADPDLMKQMVMNLVMNAVEAMPDGGALRIETVNTELDDDFCRIHDGMKPGPYVMLSVADTGRGMGKEMIERLFDPFFSTKERDYHKGTGLGLPVVHGIVMLHGGCITVESEVGKGTTFQIFLPSLTAREAADAAKEIPDIPSGHETVLLVEDEETVRQLETTVLEMKGYRVLAAADGQEALEVYKREQANISLVILDIIMPRMEGKECMEELLKLNPAVKVLVVTGVARDELIDEVVGLGARGSLIKPHSTKEFLRKVRSVLDSD